MKKSQLISLLPLVALAAMLFALAGCETDPTEPDVSGAPQLPNPQQLEIDLSFFEQSQQMAKSDKQYPGENFFNAYLRVVVIDLMLKYYLTPPVAAFALALHTVPSPQEDGSFIWVYTYVQGEDELQIRLHGTPMGDNVHWELRVYAPNAEPPVDGVLWFDGETRNDGQFGTWTFYDFELEGQPAVSTIEWGEGLEGNYLTITALFGEDEGDVLNFTDSAPLCTIDYFDASEQSSWFINWNEADHTGSIMVPDYNGGLEACWDENLQDVECSL